MSHDTNEKIAELKDRITELVANGFWSPEDVEELAVEFFDGEIDLELLRGPAKQFTKEAFDTHRREQAFWPEVTDCDRLDAAFNELEERGIISRQNFSCCGTCGAAEIVDEMREAFDAGTEVRGYTFYHQQDTDAAVEGFGICLNYGSVDDGEKPALSIANEIVSTLKHHGLRPEWDGSWNKRISVPLDWKRRL